MNIKLYILAKIGVQDNLLPYSAEISKDFIFFLPQ